MTDEQGLPRRRGRPARSERADASGYRMTPTLRRQISVARGFTGANSTQAFIDQAVRAYLRHLRETMPNFRVAADALDAEIRREPSTSGVSEPEHSTSIPNTPKT
jgi:hypothetical protein